MKTCSKCRAVLPLSEFGRRSRTKSGLKSWCKMCRAAYNKEYAKKNAATCGARCSAWKKQHPEIHRASKLKRKYGLTLEQFEEMAEAQGNVCAICGRPNQLGRKLFVDHDHETNVVRGLLCANCNTAIGMLDEDVNRFHAAVQYLDKFK